MDSKGRTSPGRLPLGFDLAWAGGLLALLCLLTGWMAQPPLAFIVLVALLYLAVCACAAFAWPPGRDFGWANRATLLRSTLVITLVALAPFAGTLDAKAGIAVGLWAYAAAALLALILDGLDGKVARATGSQSKFGACFDMELDALFILGLCVAALALNKAGAWVLALGLMRYAFVAAGFALHWLNRPLPDSFRRKTICVWQIVTLLVAILPPVTPLFASTTLATALALLVWSFFLDIRWLYQRRHCHDID
ncbi:MAG: CDP-alcohol phosphatidyltransferase family protein [Pseudomonadota bacterium]|nr:CDP-alcohol phosphatidyltransferase family protein [Pseudomonadota bacterium]